MPDISIRCPLSIDLDTVDMENHYHQSMELQFIVKETNYTQSIECRGTFWIETAIFDSFVGDLKSPAKSDAVFHDIDKNFMIHIKKNEESFELKVQKETIGDSRNAFMQFYFSSSFPHDYHREFAESFLKYPKWW